ncbi:MAG: UDP-glucose/GDP-mannose dehydrogenase family protein [Candidatus Krumholzibacteriaceae bacterium]
MKISVMGLGYVGCVSAACLANGGHEVVGVDVNPLKVDLMRGGTAPIIEEGIGEIIRANVTKGSLRVTTDAAAAIAGTDISVVCVGTPSKPNGSLELSYIEKVCEEIGAAIGAKDGRHLVIIRSTILPGTMRKVVIPAIEGKSGLAAGSGFGICFNPEFLREGTSVEDYYNPPKIVVGSETQDDAIRVREMYGGIEAPTILTTLEVAEMVKYVDNSFHALKVTFANEIGNICKELGIDSHAVMDIFCSDRKLNLSPYYLKPGFAFGGSCLPKDLRALTYKANALDLKAPVLASILESNEYQIRRGLQMILNKGKKNVGVLGFSFKAGTDDLRESPIVMLIESLIGKGYKLKVYDTNVNLAKLFGANKEYIEKHIEHISNLMTTSIDELVSFADIIVIGNKSEEFKKVLAMLTERHDVIDLVRIDKDVKTKARYEGLCW